jgi:hypothetical protein
VKQHYNVLLFCLFILFITHHWAFSVLYAAMGARYVGIGMGCTAGKATAEEEGEAIMTWWIGAAGFASAPCQRKGKCRFFFSLPQAIGCGLWGVGPSPSLPLSGCRPARN